MQEAFLKLSAAQPVPTNPAAWLYRVVRHAAISASRAERRRGKHEQARQQSQPEWFVYDPATSIDAESAVRSLQSLVLEEREAVIAHVWGGLTFEEMAEALGTSSSTAHRLYTQALQKLRLALGATHAPG